MPEGYPWSHSRLSTGSCPRRFQWKYVEGNAEPSSPEAERGRAVHEAAEAYVRHCVQVRRESDRAYLAGLARRVEDGETRRLVENLADCLLVDAALVMADETGVEKSFDLPLPNGDRLLGRIDRLDYDDLNRDVIVWDYKSTVSYVLPEECPAQLLLYGWAATQLVPRAEVVTLRLMYLGSKRQKEWQFEAGEMEPGWIVEWIEQVRAAVEVEQPPEEAGSWCAYCGRLLECARSRAQDNTRILDLADAERVAADALVLEEAAGRARKAVDGWRRQEGNAAQVRVGDMVRGDFLPVWFGKELHCRPREDTLLEELLAVFAAAGLDPAAYLSGWDEKKLGKLLEQVSGGEDNPFLSKQETALGEALGKLLEPVEPRVSAGWKKLKAEGDDPGE